jgi:hypothetical protein
LGLINNQPKEGRKEGKREELGIIKPFLCMLAHAEGERERERESLSQRYCGIHGEV